MNLALDPAQSVSVAASAGSGKTWQLVSRIVRLLLAGAAPGGILALTFTRKAASEMRERVDARLRELAFADEAMLDARLRELDLVPEPALRERARSLYEALLHAPFGLRAQTLHAFCQDLLTRFAVEAEVPAGFTLVESERELVAEALDAVLAELLRAPESREAQALTTLIALDASEATIRSWLHGFVERRSDWWALVADSAASDEDAVAAMSAQLADALGIDPDNPEAPKAAFDAPAFIENLRLLQDLLIELGGFRTLNTGLLAKAVLATDAAERGREAANLLTAKGRRSLSATKSVSDAVFARLMALYDALCTTLEQVRERRLARETWQRTVAAATLGTRVIAKLDEALRARHALSFADLEWKSYRLLRDETQLDWVRYKLDQRLDHLLLDEFQDTNPTQWSLLLPLLEDMANDGERQRTAFVVGDAKQSIYGFRRANPELLGTAADYLDARLRGRRMPLNASRRSAPAIIDFVNALFSGEAGAAIAFEPHETHRGGDWGAVEVAALVTSAREEADAPNEDAAASGSLRNPLTTPRRSLEDLRLATEGARVAQRIEALLAAGLPVIDGNAVRAIRPGDIMILARQRTHLHGIEQALAARGIPFVGSSKGGLLDTVLAQDFMALLRLLDSPGRDLDLAHVLRSPLFAASDDDLVQLAEARTQGDWWQRLQALAAEGLASPALQRAARQLADWLAAARRLPAHDLVDRIDAELGAAARYEAALPGDRRVRANLGAFLQRVLDADQGRYPTLGRLNTELQRLAAAGQDAPDEAAPALADAVRVMTIHASKGLEAPAVFLVNTACKAPDRHAGWQVDWPSSAERPTRMLLIGRQDSRDRLSADMVAAQAQREAREALNLLYVAVTRARQYLFVSAFEQKRIKPELSWYGALRSAAERLPAASMRLPGCAEDSLAASAGTFPALASPPAPSGAVDAAALAACDARLRERFAAPVHAEPPSGRPEDPQDSEATARGIAIHWLIEQLCERRLPDEARLPARLEAVCERAIDPAQIPGWLAEARRVVAAPALARFFDPARLRRSWNEVPVQWLAGETLRSGVIDRLVDDGTQLWILDYKTALQPRAAALLARHAGQLAAYAEAVRQLWPGRPVSAGLVLTATAEWLPLGS